MSNRRKIKPFGPDLGNLSAMPDVLGKRTVDESEGEPWTEEDMTTLRRLSRSPDSCETFVVLGLEPDAPGMTHVPGYEPMRIHLGGTGMDADAAVAAVARWVDAERDAARSQN